MTISIVNQEAFKNTTIMKKDNLSKEIKDVQENLRESCQAFKKELEELFDLNKVHVDVRLNTFLSKVKGYFTSIRIVIYRKPENKIDCYAELNSKLSVYFNVELTDNNGNFIYKDFSATGSGFKNFPKKYIKKSSEKLVNLFAKVKDYLTSQKDHFYKDEFKW